MTAIKTERLTLRPLTVADAPKMGAFLRDKELARMIALGAVPEPEIAAEGYILLMEAKAPLGQEHAFAVDLDGEGFIGAAMAELRPNGGAEVGFWLGRPFWGRGLGSEIARAIAGFGKSLGRTIHSGHFDDAPQAGAVLKKAGFAYTGAVEPRFSLARKQSVPMRIMALDAA